MKFSRWQLGPCTQLGAPFLSTLTQGSNCPLNYFQNLLPTRASSPPLPTLLNGGHTVHSRADWTQVAPQAWRKPLASPVHGQILQGLLGSLFAGLRPGTKTGGPRPAPDTTPCMEPLAGCPGK